MGVAWNGVSVAGNRGGIECGGMEWGGMEWVVWNGVSVAG
jgi:hypothetical protein